MDIDMPLVGKIELRSLLVGTGLLIVGMGAFTGTNGKFFGIEVNQPQGYLLGYSWIQAIGLFTLVAGGFMMVNSVGVLSRIKGMVEDIPVVGDVVEITETQTTI